MKSFSTSMDDLMKSERSKSQDFITLNAVKPTSFNFEEKFDDECKNMSLEEKRRFMCKALGGEGNSLSLSSMYRKLDNYKLEMEERRQEKKREEQSIGDKISREKVIRKYLDSIDKKLKRIEDRDLENLHIELKIQYASKQVERVIQESLFSAINKKKLFMSKNDFNSLKDREMKFVENLM